MHQPSSLLCLVCQLNQAPFWCQDSKRRYFRCEHCGYIFADPASQLPKAGELAIYQQHQNNPADPYYRAFLNKLAAPLQQRLLCTGLTGLDFGSGPGPTLSLMLQQQGQLMHNYDPFFAPEPAALSRQYDFICCTEAMEHFYQPAVEWQLWLQLLKVNGWLGIMTKLAMPKMTTAALSQAVLFDSSAGESELAEGGLVDSALFSTAMWQFTAEQFLQWHYKNDPTHVGFFSAKTFAFLAQRDHFQLEIVASDVILLQRLSK